jgi:ribosome maturation factor RimP
MCIHLRPSATFACIPRAEPPLATWRARVYLPAFSDILHGFGGWPSRAAFFGLDHATPQIIGLDEHGLEARLTRIVAPSLGAMGYELVRVLVLGRERPTVQIMADRADGAMITVDDCEQISHAIGAVLDVEDPIPGEWNLEVSSAGIDRPLTRVKDWNRFAGHAARAESAIPIDGRKRFSGVALGADETHARMRLDDGTEVSLPLADLRRPRLVLTDALIAAASAIQKPN